METGTIINQYKIISAIGKGGMGEVWLAEDTRLARQNIMVREDGYVKVLVNLVDMVCS